MIVAIPAHNEEEVIADCLWALYRQSVAPSRVVVILDNCSDGTEERIEAFRRGWIAEVFTTSNNEHKKAGALNQFFKYLEFSDDDYVLVQDADSFLDEGFIEGAVEALGDSSLGAVGGTFRGRDSGGYVSFCEASEFVRYQRDTARLKGKALTLTGTATVFRGRALKDLQKSRGGDVYTTLNLTEDLESNVRLMNLGWKIKAPKSLTLTTETMGNFRDLYRQRLRWREGAVRTVMEYGFVRGCRELYLRLIYSFIGILVLFFYLGTLVWAIPTGNFQILPFWVGISLIFALEQFISVSREGVKRALVGGVLVVEMPYMVFLQFTNFIACLKAVFNHSKEW